MVLEAMEFEYEEVTELELLLLSLRPESSALPSAATRRPRTTTRICSRRTSRLSRSYPPPASAPVRLAAPGLEGSIAVMDVDQDQPLEARRSQEHEPEVEFVMTPPPSIDHIRHGIPSSTGGNVPTTRPVRHATASTSRRTRPRVAKFRSAYWVWNILSRLPIDPLPPCDINTSE